MNFQRGLGIRYWALGLRHFCVLNVTFRNTGTAQLRLFYLDIGRWACGYFLVVLMCGRHVSVRGVFVQ